jgi:hypothetical protein
MAQPSQRSGLLSLPPEIRAVILSHVFAIQPRLTIKWSKVRPSIDLQILAACRLLNEEGTAALATTIRSNHGDSPLTVLSLYPPSDHSVMKVLEKYGQCITHMEVTQCHQIHQVLSLMPNLETITIRFYDKLNVRTETGGERNYQNWSSGPVGTRYDETLIEHFVHRRRQWRSDNSNYGVLSLMEDEIVRFKREEKSLLQVCCKVDFSISEVGLLVGHVLLHSRYASLTFSDCPVRY